MQLRTRLTIQFILLVASILILALWFIFYEFKKMSETDIYANLRSKAMMTAEMVLKNEENLRVLDYFDINDSLSKLPSRDNVLIFNSEGKTVFAYHYSKNIHHAPIFDERTKEVHKSDGNQYFLEVRYQTVKGNTYYIMAESKSNLHEVDHLRSILVFTFFIIIFVVAIGGWLYTGQALRPVSKIVKQVESISPSNLDYRLSTTNNNDEIGKMIFTFNNLLGRVQQAFSLQKNFISNVSHEVKNPIAVILSQVEVALNKENKSVADYRATLESIRNDVYDLSETTENLLQLARIHAEEHQQPTFEQVQLDDLLMKSISNLSKVHRDYHISFDIVGTPESAQDLVVIGNPLLLRAAFTNLIDNACKYSKDKTAVIRFIMDSDGKKIVEVEDNGQGIAQEDIQTLMKPFYRDPKHKNIRGTGIGLSLVDSILKIHKVPLQIRSEREKGTVFAMQFS
jgi:signal transduction histidine kinase